MEARRKVSSGMNGLPETYGPIVAIGELLWDLLPDGPHLGGAPYSRSLSRKRGIGGDEGTRHGV